jgi:hypothetical protein
MKKARNVADLAARLSAAAETPLQAPVAPVVVQDSPPREPVIKKAEAKRGRVAGVGTAPVYLRLPNPLHERLEAIAMERTRETGKGVSIQQVIIDVLGDRV